MYTQRSGNVSGVSAARALAITLVLGAHLIGLWTGTQGFRWTPWQAWLGLVIDPLRIDHQAGGHAGLLIFFLVSGFIVSQAAESESQGAFALKRALRLLPAMIVAVLLTLLVATVVRHQHWTPVQGFVADRAYSGWTVLEAVGLGPTFGGIGVLFVLWSLSVEYYWYFLLGVFHRQALARPIASTWAFAALLVVLCRVADLGHIGPLHLVRDHLLYVFVILIGRWVYLWRSDRVSRAYAAGAGVAMAALYCWQLWSEDGRDVLTGPHPRVVALAWACAAFVALLVLVRTGPWPPVQFVADISYGLYVYHVPVMWLVLPVVSPGGRAFPLGLALTVAVLVALSWASHVFLEQPARRLARTGRLRRSGTNQRATPVV